MDSNRPLKNLNGEKELVYLFTIKGVDKNQRKNCQSGLIKHKKYFQFNTFRYVKFLTLDDHNF